MPIMIGRYKCKHCENQTFELFKRRQRGSWGTIEVPVLRCTECREAYDIGCTNTNGLVYEKERD